MIADEIAVGWFAETLHANGERTGSIGKVLDLGPTEAEPDYAMLTFDGGETVKRIPLDQLAPA